MLVLKAIVNTIKHANILTNLIVTTRLLVHVLQLKHARVVN